MKRFARSATCLHRLFIRLRPIGSRELAPDGETRLGRLATEPREFRTAQTLLVKSRWSIFNAMGVSVTREIYLISLASKRGMQNRLPTFFE
jgi:hypothetical protein